MNLLLKLGRNFGQEVRSDAVEQKIVFPRLVDLVHFLVLHERHGRRVAHDRGRVSQQL